MKRTKTGGRLMAWLLAAIMVVSLLPATALAETRRNPYPPTPPITHLYNKKDTGKPCLYWDKLSSAVKYEVWRRVGQNGDYQLYYTTDRNFMNNISAKPGITYYYMVRAIGDDGQYSKFGQMRYITCDCALPVVKAGVRENFPYLTWEPVEGAAKYEIWRRVGTEGAYELQYTTTKPWYTNTSAKSGQTYQYKVRSICGVQRHGNSGWTEGITIVAPVQLMPPTLKAYNDEMTGKPYLCWDPYPQNNSRYEIWRRVGEKGDFVHYYDTGSLYMNNFSAKCGQTYYYMLRAYTREDGWRTAFSNMVSVVCKCEMPLDTVQLVNGKPTLDWEPVEGADAYEIYLGDTYGYSHGSLLATTTDTRFVHEDAAPGDSYGYYLRAVVNDNPEANSDYAYSGWVTAE